MRIAWFSPFPPVRTGIAACSAEAVAALRARRWTIDEFGETRAHDFPWIHAQRPYDLIVYQFGNSSHHDYVWPYALRYPGLVVLHDTRLHHARAALLLREKRPDDYRRELAWSEPVNADAAELAVAGFDSRLYYNWPMLRGLLATARVVAVHGEGTRRELTETLSAPASDVALIDKIVSIRLGHGRIVSPDREAVARATIRAKYAIPREAVLFGVFGGLTAEKRLQPILAAFRATLPYAPDAHLLLGGAVAEAAALKEWLAAPDGVPVNRITLTGYVDEDELTDHVAAVDVSLNLRWPTARETSGPWLRALAAGKPTVVLDLAHLTDVPSLDPRTWQTSATGRSEAVTVAIDVLDEDHSLRLAMRRLATDGGLRAALGQAGQRYWQREHSIDAMIDDYERVLRGANRDTGATSDAATAGLPAHLRPSGDDRLRDLLRPFAMDSPL